MSVEGIYIASGPNAPTVVSSTGCAVSVLLNQQTVVVRPTEQTVGYLGGNEQNVVVLVDNPTSVGSGGGGSVVAADEFLANPDLLSEEATYFFFGWESVNSSWLIQRQFRSNSQNSVATVTVNPSYATLDAAWPNRASLTYL